MFRLGLFIGVYAYILFGFGLLGILYKINIIIFTCLYGVFILGFERKSIKDLFLDRFIVKEKKLFYLFLLLFFFQVLVNFIAVVGPELGFDALWYHLTLPQLYLINHSIFFIPGGLLYYSAMPKIAEMLYLGGLSFGNESTVKFIHFSFGLLICFALYKFQRKFLPVFASVIGVIIFYSNLVVSWESASAYIDLVRTFFEVMALWGFVNWWEMPKNKWLFLSALMLGLEITTKMLSIGSLLIFILLIGYKLFRRKESLQNIFSKIVLYIFITLLIPLPWFIFAYLHTHNPFYPIFSPYLTYLNGKVFTLSALSPTAFLITVGNTFIQAADPITPMYLMILPLTLIMIVKRKIKYGYIGSYCLLGILFWYSTAKIEGTRLLLPYLPALSLLCGLTLNELKKHQKQYGNFFVNTVMVFVISSSLLSIGYRFFANVKYLPLIVGAETKDAFLSDQLHFSFGDFYDTDHYFKKYLKPTDTVLLYGFHNLYYVDFSFIDATWVKKGDRFTLVATQNAILPSRFQKWKLIYTNKKTMVKLYKSPTGTCHTACFY